MRGTITPSTLERMLRMLNSFCLILIQIYPSKEIMYFCLIQAMLDPISYIERFFCIILCCFNISFSIMP